MRTITITTTVEDMKRWNAAEDKCCPIKHAIERATGISRHYICVTVTGFLLLCEPPRLIVGKGKYNTFNSTWPTEVSKWIKLLDDKKAVEPITFEVEIP